MANLHRSGISQVAQSRQVAVIRGMITDFERTVQILTVDILTEEEHVRVFDPSAPSYPILARTLRARLDNLLVTIDALRQRLPETATAAHRIEVADLAEKVDGETSEQKPAGVNRRTVLGSPYL